MLYYNQHHKDIGRRWHRHCGSATAMRPWATDSHTPSHAPLARGYNCQAAMPLFKTANWLFHLSHPSTLFSQPFLCLPLFAEQIGGVAQRAEGVSLSLRSSENQLLSVCFHRRAVSAEWNISLNTILSTLYSQLSTLF